MRNLKPMVVISILTGALALSGCYKAKIHLRTPQPVTTSASVNDALHVSLFGLFEVSAAVNLEEACAGGTVRIDERLSILGILVNAVLGTVVPAVQIMNPTAKCGQGRSAAGMSRERLH